MPVQRGDPYPASILLSSKQCSRVIDGGDMNSRLNEGAVGPQL